jgi:hypothetical protein
LRRQASQNLLHDFANQIKKYYARGNKYDGDHIVTTFKMYFNFLKIYADPRLTQCNAKQWEAFEISLRNFESFWWRTRRGGKTIGMSVLQIFYSLIEFGQCYPGVVVHRCPSGDQLRMLYYWLSKNPFCTNINNQTHFIDVMDSPSIWASMTTKDNSDGYGCSVLFEDEWGTIQENDLKHTYLESTRSFLLEGDECGKRLFHASTLHYGSVGARDMLFLEQLGMESNENYVSVMTWRDCNWIKQQTIDKEKLKHFDNPQGR